ncbi:hypothetical protein AJ79_10101 [Helicocarpus griseus UAMH5409]|uniref:Carrier domain-containing protein n=1 Tax=Helicocarpus griseus UAMH5409 TaxID=1447875 RepID=A0A2B7WFR8_9EURO|nr:hypothetical protein AJ79_10101 [Helicocarpus griseus UAMH5409]
MNSVFQHCYEDLHELTIKRDSASECYQLVFLLFPEDTVYRTEDLLSRHSTKPGLWRNHGRVDNIIFFLNGEKTNPEPFDDHPEVSKSRFLFADPLMPILRTEKGTIQQQATAEQYAGKLDALYSDKLLSFNKITRPSSLSAITIAATIRQQLSGVTKSADIPDDLEFFSSGMDSIETLFLWRKLKSALNLLTFAADIYSCPSISRLSQFITKVISFQAAERRGDLQTVGTILDHYKGEIDNLASFIAVTSMASRTFSHIVLLTGSSGSVGSLF